MMTPKKIDPEDLALYAMQLLSPEEAAVISLLLEQNPAARQELAEIQGDLAAFAFTAEMHTPPALARTRFIKKVAREKRSMPAATQSSVAAASWTDLAPTMAQRDTAAAVTSISGYHRGAPVPQAAQVEAAEADAPLFSYEAEAARPGFVRRAVPWMGWALAAGLGFASFTFYRQEQELKGTVDSDQVQLALSAAEAASARQVKDVLNDPRAVRVVLTEPLAPVTPTGRVTYAPDKGVLIFAGTKMKPLEEAKVYELWLIPVIGNPIPAGTFRPDANGFGNVVTDMPKGLVAGQFGITIENAGGAKTPTMPIVLAGAAG
jgi:anti-sigma-K factor RskA